MRVQSSQQRKQNRVPSKQSIESKKKSVLPFSKQLLNLQKKIQQVEDKNELILQKIHKAYDFKKNKNKVYYEAPGFGEEEEDEQFEGEIEESIPVHTQIKVPMSESSYQQNQRVYTSIQPQYNEPREFQVDTARKNSSLIPTPAQNRYYQHNNNLENGLPLILNLPQIQSSQQYYTRYNRLQIPAPYQEDHHQLDQDRTSGMESQSSQGEIDFKSSSNYSDVERRKKIIENVKRREKDFSDIKSNIEERRVKPQKMQRKPNGKKSFIYNAIENNSLYSEGNVPSKQMLEGDDLEPVETPITTQPMLLNIAGTKSAYQRPLVPLPLQQRMGIHSTNQLIQNQYILPQHHTITSLPQPPPQMAYSITARSPQYQTQTSANQVNFLQQMCKTERQKSNALQKEMQKKQQSIQHLKKYKKSFKRFFEDTHYVIEQAFDQFVETFLRNRVYKIQKLVKKNENKLSALMIQLKDFKQQRQYTKNLKSLSTRIGKKSYSTNERFQKQSRENSSQDDPGLEQNYSTISSRSRDRSVSGTFVDDIKARKRCSKDKSLTKKSNQSQNLIKKEFDTIAENYQAMIKVKNEEIEKYEAEIKQAKTTIIALQEENNRLKIALQQYQNQNQSQVVPSQQQQSSQLTGSNTEPEVNFRARQNSGNLRILTRNSSRSDLKKGSNVQDTETLLQKIKKYQQEVEKLQSNNTLLEEKIQSINKQFVEKEVEIGQLTSKIRSYEVQFIKSNQQKIDNLQQMIKRLNDSNSELIEKNNELNTEIQIIKQKLNEKQIKILQLDSQLYLKDSELKKLDNLLTLKTHKLEEFNKLLLEPSGKDPLNDSVSSAFDDPHNKTTFQMLENLQKQLEEEKYEKEIEFLNLKKSYEAKIEQLKVEFQQIAQENQKLAQRLNNDQAQRKQWQEEKSQLEQVNEQLKQKIEELHKEVSFLTDKVNFFETERKTVSFAQIPKNSETLLLKSDENLDLLKPQILEEHDFEDFVVNDKNSVQSKQSQKGSGQTSLLDESHGTANFNVQKAPDEENPYEKKCINTNLTNQNLQNKLSLLKDQNIDLCQKVAKFQKQNKFLKENETEMSTRYENIKDQLSGFTKKYEELELYNHELLKIIEDLEKEKNEIFSAAKEQHGTSPFDWKEVEKNVEISDLKRSGMWSFAQKEEFLLDRTSKDFDIRGSVVSSFAPNRPSRQSHENSDKKVEQLTKKLSQTELLLENKEKINEQLIIGFTKKIDKINTQNENQAKQQAKVIQKYIQQNSKLRKQRQKIDEELDSLKKQLLKLKQQLKSDKKIVEENFQSGVEEINIENHQEDQINCNMLQQRIDGQGFMLGINQIEDNESNKTPQKKQVKFSTILEEDNIDFEDFEERQEKIELLEKQTRELQETIEKLQKFLEETLNKVKQKQDQKTSLVQELQRKNVEVEELRDLIELKEVGKLQGLSISKQLNGAAERPSIQKSQRSRMNSVISLKYSQTHHGQRQRRLSFDDDLNFDFLESNNNQELNLDHSRVSGIYSENMSMIFEKEENFLDQIKKAKNKRKQEGRLLKKTFEYIKKLRTTLNDKNKKIKLLQMRLQELKDNCWLWKKRDEKKSDGQHTGCKGQILKTLSKNEGSRGDSQEQNYLDHNQSLSDDASNKLVDSRVFECNSEDLNKKKPYRHNHYKKMQFDTKLIVEENKILNKQIQMLQQELIKIEDQENGLMAVKELYKEEIRALTRQNQEQATAFQQQIEKLQDILESSEAVHNFEAIKQLFKKIIDCIGAIIYPNTCPESKRKNIHQLKEQKRKQAEECIKVICSILGYEDNVKNQICLRLTGQPS